MRLFALAFVAGTWLLQQRAGLPEFAGLALAAASLGVAACVRVLDRRVRAAAVVAFGMVLGFAHAAWRAELRLADALPRSLEGRDVVVTGVVTGLPQ